jgi:hypothetical protein
MGSHTFHNESRERDVEKAYKELVTSALFEYGHEPYNGTISTTSGYNVASTRPMSRDAAAKLADSRIEALSKWGPCEAIAVGATTKTKRRTISFTVDRRPEPGNILRIEACDVAAALHIGTDHIQSFTVTESTPKYRYATRRAGPARKVWTAGGRTFATRTEAAAYAKSRIEQDLSPAWASNGVVLAVHPQREIVVCEQIVRDPQAAVTATLASWKVKVVAEIADPSTLQFDHWLFYGWASS